MQFTSPSSSLLSSPRIRTVSSSSVVVVDPLETTTTPASIITSTTTSATSNSTTTSTPPTGFTTTPISSTKQQKQDDSKSTKWQRIVSRHVTNLERKSPLVKKTMDTARRIPPRWRMIFLCGWLIWKVISAYILLRITLHAGGGTLHMLGFLDYYGGESSTTTTTSSSGRLLQQQQQQYSEHPTRLLYIVTALAEYNNGQRSTTKGQDRLAEVLIPVLVETVEALLSSESSSRFDVDVYLVLGYELKPERRKLIQDRLPSSVGLEVWDDAIPLGYPKENSQKRITPNTRALARQHRFVIKDKMRYYDVFLALEDDMRMTGIQVQHFLDMTLELETLEAMAPETTTGVPEQLDGDPAQMKFYGNMTKGQLKRIVPGWIRVEVLNNEEKYGAQETLDPIELDYTFPLSTTGTTEDGSQEQQQYYHLDPTICCHIPNMKPNRDTPNTKPNATDVIVWETNVRALQLREMPRYGSSSSSFPISDKLDWTVLLLGLGKREKQEEKVGGYWSGRTTRTSSSAVVATPPFGQDYKRPSGGPPDLVAQQGGWLLTRFQILRLDTELCQGNFLPPFSLPTYHEDGHQAMNVEYWSGSYQIFTGVRGGCNMQRILSFHPHHFSKHFVYHVANNKQKQLKQNRMVRANHIWGQLITVYKAALQSKKQQEEEEERMKKQALTKKK